MVDGPSLSQAVQTTFLTSGTATVLAMLIGVPLGAWCARQQKTPFYRLKTLITALYGLPPVVVGVFVYSLFSKSGALGSLDLLFTVEAMIFAQNVSDSAVGVGRLMDGVRRCGQSLQRYVGNARYWSTAAVGNGNPTGE